MPEHPAEKVQHSCMWIVSDFIQLCERAQSDIHTNGNCGIDPFGMTGYVQWGSSWWRAAKRSQTNVSVTKIHLHRHVL